ncbi:hypothetical protein V492_08312 [Pseudogymnoascus sp. VKM F-4246]|nr:hypothetical protein V492_08312 [Pseudogymnoascus sp. VKM F-4246]
MALSTTAFIHTIILCVSRWGRPPILDLDALGIYVISRVSVSMCPAMVVFLLYGPENRLVKTLIGLWFLMMFNTTMWAAEIINQGTNVEVACFFPDKTLLTTFAQLIGGQSLDCTYNCFLKSGSVLKAQGAAMVVRGSLAHDGADRASFIICDVCCVTMVFLGAYFCTNAVYSKPHQKAIANGGSHQGLYAIMTPIAWISLISITPWLIMIEYSIWNIPAEENFNSIGQWSPWVIGVLGSVVAFLSSLGDPVYDKGKEDDRRPVINETANGSLADGQRPSFVRPGGRVNIQTDNLREPAREGDQAGHASNGIASQRYVPKSYTAPDGQVFLRRVRSASIEGDTAYIREEADIGTYRPTWPY